MDRIGPKWKIGPNWTEVDKLDRIGPEWTNRTEVDQIGAM